MVKYQKKFMKSKSRALNVGSAFFVVLQKKDT